MKLPRLLILVALLFSTTTGALADTSEIPIDPLVRSESVSGGYEVNIGLSYTPDGEHGLSMNETGVAPYVRTRRRITLPVTLRHNLSDVSSVSLSVTPTVSHTTTTISGMDTKSVSSATDTSVTTAVGFRHQFSPTHSLDPVLTVSLNMPEKTLDIGLFSSWIRDPVVLSASLMHLGNIESNKRRLVLGLGTAFLANDKVAFKVSTRHMAAFDAASLPQWSFLLGVVYTADLKGNSDVFVGIERVDHAGNATVGLTIEWYKTFST